MAQQALDTATLSLTHLEKVQCSVAQLRYLKRSSCLQRKYPSYRVIATIIRLFQIGKSRRLYDTDIKKGKSILLDRCELTHDLVLCEVRLVGCRVKMHRGRTVR